MNCITEGSGVSPLEFHRSRLASMPHPDAEALAEMERQSRFVNHTRRGGRYNRRPVICLTTDPFMVFRSISDAARFFRVTPGTLASSIRRENFCAGHCFAYCDRMVHGTSPKPISYLEDDSLTRRHLRARCGRERGFFGLLPEQSEVREVGEGDTEQKERAKAKGV